MRSNYETMSRPGHSIRDRGAEEGGGKQVLRGAGSEGSRQGEYARREAGREGSRQAEK